MKRLLVGRRRTKDTILRVVLEYKYMTSESTNANG